MALTTPRWQAAAKGLKRYQDKPCKVCQCTTRYTSSGGCVDCTGKRTQARAEKMRKLLNRE